MSARKIVQIVLLVALAVAAIRLVVVLRQRESGAGAKPNVAETAPPLNPEYYVTPKKLHAYDLKSLNQLTEQPEWAKEGYRYTIYPFNPKTNRADLNDEIGVLLPIQKIQVTKVVAQVTPGAPSTRQLLAVYEDGGTTFAVPVGTVTKGNYQIYADEMFYYQDPHQLYDFWGPEIWQAIDEHKMKKGMDELQASMALGMGEPHRGQSENEKVVIYPNGGHRVTVTYRDGKAVGIVVRD